jgi:hypothetical protein
MSTYNEYCGIVYLTPGCLVTTITDALCQAIGSENQTVFFGEAIIHGDDGMHADHLNFNAIPPEGANTDVIERAMLALAPFVDLEPGAGIEIDIVRGSHWANAGMYRFLNTKHGVVVECSSASLKSNGDWSLVSTPVRSTDPSDPSRRRRS